MRLRTYKFVVVPVLQRIDADGVVTGEQEGGQDVVFGLDGLERYAAGFQAAVEQGNEQIAAAAAEEG